MAEVAGSSFPTTHWSQIELTGHQDPSIRTGALQRLLRQYIRPMQLHLGARVGLDAESAEELVQEFLLNKVLRLELFARAEQGKGRFRTYLLTSLDRFACNAARDRRARGCQSLEEISEPVDPAPEVSRVFDAAWAREVLERATRRMREDCHRRGRDDVWRVFESRLIAPALEDAKPVVYEKLIARLQLDSASDGSNLLVTAKRAFARALRSVVGEYEKEPREIEQEIAALRAALSRR